MDQLNTDWFDCRNDRSMLEKGAMHHGQEHHQHATGTDGEGPHR